MIWYKKWIEKYTESCDWGRNQNRDVYRDISTIPINGWSSCQCIFQLKQKDNWLYISIVFFWLKKGHDDMAIPAVEEVVHVASYPLLEYMGFDTDISDGVAKMRTATLLGDIFCLHHVHRKSNYEHLLAILDFSTQESFSRTARDKGWFEKFFSIRQVERRKIRWPWYNTCQSIF